MTFGTVSEKKLPRGAAPVIAALALFLAALARAAYMISAYLASDIVYADSLVSGLTDSAATVLAVLFKAAIYGGTAYAAVNASRASTFAVAGIGCGVSLAYYMSAFAADMLTGAIAGKELFALVFLSLSLVFDAFVYLSCAFVCSLTVRICRERGAEEEGCSFMSPATTSGLTLLLATLTAAAVALITTAYEIITFLIDYNFDPNATEIYAMTADVSSDILLTGVLGWLAAAAVYRLCCLCRARVRSQDDNNSEIKTKLLRGQK